MSRATWLCSPLALTNDVVSAHGTNVRRTQTYVWASVGSSTPTLIATDETSVDGLNSWHIVWNNGVGVTNTSQTVIDSAHGLRVVTETAAAGAFTVTTNQNGRIISMTPRDSGGAQIGQTLYGYDAH